MPDLQRQLLPNPLQGRGWRAMAILSGFLLLGSLTPCSGEMEKTFLTLAVIELSSTKEAAINLQERQSLTDVIRGIARKHLPVSQWIILTRENIKEQLDSGTDLSNCVDKCVIEAGRKLKVDYLLSGNITRLGSNLQVTLNYYDIDDIEMGNIKGSAWASGKDVDDLIGPLEKTSDSLFTSLAKLHPPEDASKKKVDSKAGKDWDQRFGGTQVPKRFGVGIHWAPVLGFQVKKSAGDLADSVNNPDLVFRSLSLEQKGVTGLQGLGLKFWMGDYFEAAFNLQFGYYPVDLVADTVSYPLKFDLGRPLLSAKPYFFRYVTDVAGLYPIRLPSSPAVQFHAGGGLSLSSATKIMTANFAKNALQNATNNGTVTSTSSNEEMVDAIDAAFQKEKAELGFGGFAQLGARYKPAFMPVETYLDLKYHLFILNPTQVAGPDITLELGAAFVF